MRRSALALLLLCIMSSVVAARPNVLLIISEDNGLQFGCYGDFTVPTPHVDALASSGVRFERAYCTQAVCSPSRASIYTGLYPHQHGQIGLATHQFTMVGDVPTLPKLLHDEGYVTGLIGKLHVLPESAFPYDFRFDDKEVVSFDHRDVKKIAATAYEFMTNAARPFCLTVSFADAHLPFLREDHGLPEKPISAAAVKTLPAVGVDSPRLREQTADYYNCISRLDTGIGLLLAELERSGRAKNTLVIYVADHGPQFGRGKVTSYELGLRVPLIIREPFRTEPGAARSELVSTVDLLPTILDYAGVRAPKNLPGKSLSPLMTGANPEFRRFVFAEWNTSHAWPTPSLMFPQRSVYNGRFKLIRNLLTEVPNPAEEYYTTQALVQTGATQDEINAALEHVRAGYATWRRAPPVELYDLFHDPYELDNLADRDDYVETRRLLINALEEWRLDTNDPLLESSKLQMLMDEDRLQTWKGQTTGKKGDHQWTYPEYLYGAPPAAPKP